MARRSNQVTSGQRSSVNAYIVPLVVIEIHSFQSIVLSVCELLLASNLTIVNRYINMCYSFSLHIRSMWETICDAQAGFWLNSKFLSKFSRKPLSGISDQKAPPFRKSSDLRWPKFTPEYPPPISENAGYRMWRLICNPQGYHSFIEVNHSSCVRFLWSKNLLMWVIFFLPEKSLLAV